MDDSPVPNPAAWRTAHEQTRPTWRFPTDLVAYCSMRLPGGLATEPSALELHAAFARFRHPDEVVGGETSHAREEQPDTPIRRGGRDLDEVGGGATGSIEPEPATGNGDTHEVLSAPTFKRHGSS
jgi:hypothetical protein